MNLTLRVGIDLSTFLLLLLSNRPIMRFGIYALERKVAMAGKTIKVELKTSILSTILKEVAHAGSAAATKALMRTHRTQVSQPGRQQILKSQRGRVTFQDNREALLVRISGGRVFRTGLHCSVGRQAPDKGETGPGDLPTPTPMRIPGLAWCGGTEALRADA